MLRLSCLLIVLLGCKPEAMESRQETPVSPEKKSDCPSLFHELVTSKYPDKAAKILARPLPMPSKGCSCQRTAVTNIEIISKMQEAIPGLVKRQIRERSCLIRFFSPALAARPPWSIIGVDFVAKDGKTVIESATAEAPMLYATRTNEITGVLESDWTRPIGCDMHGYYEVSDWHHDCEQIGGIALDDVLLVYTTCENFLESEREKK